MPTARRRLADVAWLDQKMQLGFLRRKIARSALSIPATGLVVAIEPAPGSLECSRRGLSCERYRLSQERPPIQDRTAFRDVQRAEQILWKAEVGSSTATKRPAIQTVKRGVTGFRQTRDSLSRRR